MKQLLLIFALLLAFALPAAAVDPFLDVGGCDVPNELELTLEDPDGISPDGFLIWRGTFEVPAGSTFLSIERSASLPAAYGVQWSEDEDLNGNPVVVYLVSPIDPILPPGAPAGVFARALFSSDSDVCEPAAIMPIGYRPDFNSGRFGGPEIASDGAGFFDGPEAAGPGGGLQLAEACQYMDVNDNGAVDSGDSATTYLAYTTDPASPANVAAMDFNCNGAVDAGDWVSVVLAQGQLCTTGPVVCP